MKHSFFASYGKVMIRPLEEKDLEECRLLRNRYRNYFLSSQEITSDQQINWYRSYLKKDGDIMFAVTHADASDVFIGAIAVYNIDMEASTAEFGRLMVDKEKAPEKGIGFDVIRALLQIVFQNLQIQTLLAVVKKDNDRAYRLYQKIGFKFLRKDDAGNDVLSLTIRDIHS